MTVSDIAERLRSYGRAASLANPEMTMEGMSVLGYLSNIADELMEVWKEESKAIATENAVLPAVCITGDRAPEKRVADPCWAKTCEECMEDGLPDGVYCEWYGEPAGCNSPIYGQHPKYEPMCRCPSRMMTLDEAIEHAEECAKDDSPCGQNHRQLVKWLKELRATKSALIGNSAALREVVKELLDAMYDMGIDEETVSIAAESPNCHMHSVELLSVIKKAKAALSAPPRNCDVGTAKEQIKRWEKFCLEHHEYWKPSKGLTAIQRCNCPCHEGNGCNYFVWAQMPYEEGETDGGK